MNFPGKLRPMEFHKLRYFLAAAEELTVLKAAERVHVSQPALSRQIRLLEEKIGWQLFDRVNKRIHLTAPAIESELFLVTPKALADKETESLIALLKERAAGI